MPSSDEHLCSTLDSFYAPECSSVSLNYTNEGHVWHALTPFPECLDNDASRVKEGV